MAITFQIRTICGDHTRSFTNIIFPFYRAENWAQDFTNGNHCLPSLRYIPSLTDIFMPQGSCAGELSQFMEDRTENERKGIFSCFVWIFIYFFFGLLPYLSSSSKIFTIRRPFHQMYRHWGSESKQKQHVQNTMHSTHKQSNINVTIILIGVFLPITIHSISPY